jgi:phosphoribosylglycinamide formyltransferase 1
LRVTFCVSGRGALFRAAVERRDQLGIEAVLLVMDVTADENLQSFAHSRGVPWVRLDARSLIQDLRGVLDEENPDLVVLTFDRIIPDDLVERFRGRMINVHPALLPAFPGSHPVERLLRSGVRYGGATIHEVTEIVDSGAVVAQAVVATIPGEPAERYGERLYAVLEPMYLAVLRWYAEGRVQRDEIGHLRVEGAAYGGLPISPWLEADSCDA